ncbi:MAG: carboxypeptidase regulatory-like domain-containing protein [Planctomycetes bacterium]|nr:carboxypeptidase regulatory-like domain-containing protein [Planctomycetota bacterium]
MRRLFTILGLLLFILAPAIRAQSIQILNIGSPFQGKLDTPSQSDQWIFFVPQGTKSTLAVQGSQGLAPSVGIQDLTTGAPLDISKLTKTDKKGKITISNLTFPASGPFALTIASANATSGPYTGTSSMSLPKSAGSIQKTTAVNAGETAMIEFVAVEGSKFGASISPKNAKGQSAMPGSATLTGFAGDVDLTNSTKVKNGHITISKVALPDNGLYTLKITNTGGAGSFNIKITIQKPAFAKNTPPAAESAHPSPVLDSLPPSTSGPSVILKGSAFHGRSRLHVDTPLGPLDAIAGTNKTFTIPVDLQPNVLNKFFLTEQLSVGIDLPPVPAGIVQDSQPPVLFVDFPLEGTILAEPTTPVAGRVSDVLSGYQGLTVTVNGIQATVNVGIGTNATFLAENVPLNTDGTPTIIIATATDAVGNSAGTPPRNVLYEAPTGPSLHTVSGNNQTAPVHSWLMNPIVVKVTKLDGSDFPGKLITFTVIKSDGRLSATGTDAGSVGLQAFTDASGNATVFWKMGGDAGFGNDRVQISSTDISGTLYFCASATPGPATQLNVASGNNQTGAVNGIAPEPLAAWVSDSCNGVAGAMVSFTVVSGSATLESNGQNFGPQHTVQADITGHAAINLRFGQDAGKCTVEATFAGYAGSPATFVATSLAPNPATPTSLSGIVMDNASQPIQNVKCILTIGGAALPSILTNIDGGFAFASIPGSGPAKLRVEGQLADHIGGASGTAVLPGSFPALEYELVIIPNVANTMPSPILLPQLNPNNARVYDGTQDVVLTVEGIAGLQMIIKAGSMTRADNSVPDINNPEIVSLNQVHHDDVPMPMPDGAAPPFAWTLQPGGSHFNPPVQITYPNMSGLPAGAVTNFLSFNHATGKFEIVGAGHVVNDGSVIVTDPGSGISTAGWGCNCPPYAVTGNCKDCTPKPNGCGSSDWMTKFLNTPLGLGVDFTPACNAHDICYGTYPASKSQCDLAFYQNLLAICAATFPNDQSKAAKCNNLAYIYYKAVDKFGGDPFKKAQEESKACQQSQSSNVLVTKTVSTVAPPTAPFIDKDNDLMPDDWEVLVGLNPNNPLDADLDNDGDGLTNLEEYIHGTNPFMIDSDGDGVDDKTQVLNNQPSMPIELDESWTVSANGQNVLVDSIGTYRITNISASDQFGATGPGSSPDFKSDNFVRVTGVSNKDGNMRYAFSQPFQIANGQDFNVSQLVFTNTPPPMPVSLSLSVDLPTLTQLGQITNAHTVAKLQDGSFLDVSPSTSWTEYQTSSLAIAKIDSEGKVTAVAKGTAYLTAQNGGTTAVATVTVSPGDPLTTLVGFVQLNDGTPVNNAKVVIPGPNLTAFTAANGSFAIPGVPALTGNLSLSASATIGQDSYFGTLANIVPMPGSITDVGIVTIVKVDCVFDTNFGTQLSMSDDSSILESFNQGFTFPFFGQTRTQMYVNSNGNITFTSSDSTYNPQPIPGYVVNGQPRISIAFVDWNPSAGGAVYYKQLPDRAIVTWKNMPLYILGGSSTFQIQLFATGRIHFLYNGMTANGTGTGFSGETLDISVAVSPGGSPTVKSVNYNIQSPFSGGSPTEAVFENFNSGNHLDLDANCMVWNPNGTGFDVTVVPLVSMIYSAVSGTVTDEEGRGIEGAEVTIESSRDENFIKKTTSTFGGRYHFDSIPAPGGAMLTATFGGKTIGTGSAALWSTRNHIQIRPNVSVPTPKHQ